MEIIKQTNLYYQEGTSDKVYEVILYQTTANLYLVKARYGRRGSNLKEDVKTKQPVSLSEAEKIFDKTVNEKVKKGYREITDTPPVAKPLPTVPVEAQKQAILSRLASPSNKKWPLERVIWRAGELKIREATPRLLELFATGEPLRDYCIIWALGWCGDENVIPRLTMLLNDLVPQFIRRIAWEAIFKLADSDTKTAMQLESIEALPPQLRDIAKNGTAEAFNEALENYLNTTDYQGFAVLDTLYQIDNHYVRPALLKILRAAPFKPNYFKRIRHILKMAEYRQDGEVFAIITRRLDLEKELYKTPLYYLRVADNKALVPYNYQLNQETLLYYRSANTEFYAILYGDNPPIAYSDRTKQYLRKRIWRTLKQLGEENDPAYINMASEILLQYTDADAVAPKQSIFYRWNRQNWSSEVAFTRNWDSYAGYLNFNHILYENSPRYVWMHDNKAWQCREGYNPGDAIPQQREEAFPQLWQQHPQALLRLLLESNCSPVHDFAVKALGDCLEFTNNLEKDTLLNLLKKPYEVTVKFAFDIIRQKYNPQQLDIDILQAFANCEYQDARNFAYEIIQEKGDRLFPFTDFLVSLLLSDYADTRAFIARHLSNSVLSESTIKAMIGLIIAELLNPAAQYKSEIITDIQQFLTNFTSSLRQIEFNVILDLLRHPTAEIQTIGAYILLNHATPAAELPSQLIESLINSPYQSVRQIGMEIFALLPEEMLLSRYDLIVAMVTHILPDIGQSIRPVIKSLANNTSFACEILTQLINILLKKEAHEGIHSHVIKVIKEDLENKISTISKDIGLRLLNSQYTAAQELGGIVLKVNYNNWASEFTTAEIVKLANHEILSVRQAAWAMFEQKLHLFRQDSQEMLAAVRLLESKWEDSQQQAWRIFQTEFNDEHWTPEIMINICDSIVADVRQFGRDLVTRFFSESNGHEYLLKFSEHPKTDMQLFVTNFLEEFAANNIERLRNLSEYFITVLSCVNKGRIAKNKVFSFLEAEAQKSEAAAKIVGEILTRQSLTIAIGDKAKAIQAMVKIHQKYPAIALPLKIKAVETRAICSHL